MRIKRQNTNKRIRFEDLPNAEVFAMDGDANVYMKMEWPGVCENAVDIIFGEPKVMSQSQLVHHLRAELVIEVTDET